MIVLEEQLLLGRKVAIIVVRIILDVDDNHVRRGEDHNHNDEEERRMMEMMIVVIITVIIRCYNLSWSALDYVRQASKFVRQAQNMLCWCVWFETTTTSVRKFLNDAFSIFVFAKMLGFASNGRGETKFWK